MATTQPIKVTLQRDSLQTPWGFRLQGGADFRTPFTVNKVKRKGSDLNENFHFFLYRLMRVVQRMVIFIVVILFSKSIKHQLVQCFMLMLWI